MRRLYRMLVAVPTLTSLALLVSACDDVPAPPRQSAEPIPDIYLEALQDAEAVKYSLEQRGLEQRRVDALLGRAQAPER
ncbi:MAG: hypothetical protein KDJ33_16730 [Gammaproteobacteria bacterium]|nr:hypothetical protein [Gammaproteobacteria bacterium]